MTNATETVSHRVPDHLNTPLRRVLQSWESLLLAVAVAIFVANSFASPYFLTLANFEAVRLFVDRAQAARFDFELTAVCEHAPEHQPTVQAQVRRAGRGFSRRRHSGRLPGAGYLVRAFLSGSPPQQVDGATPGQHQQCGKQPEPRRRFGFRDGLFRLAVVVDEVVLVGR